MMVKRPLTYQVVEMCNKEQNNSLYINQKVTFLALLENQKEQKVERDRC